MRESSALNELLRFGTFMNPDAQHALRRTVTEYSKLGLLSQSVECGIYIQCGELRVVKCVVELAAQLHYHLSHLSDIPFCKAASGVWVPGTLWGPS